MKKGFLFILLMLLMNANIFAQNIDIIGSVRTDDVPKIKKMIEEIFKERSPRKIKLFDRNNLFYTFYRNHPNGKNYADSLLDATLESLMKLHSSRHQSNPTKKDIKVELEKLKVHNEVKVITYDKNGIPDSLLTYVDYSELIQAVNDPDIFGRKFVLLFVLSKDKPSVNFIQPVSNTTVSTKNVEGFGKGQDSISSVYVRSNIGYWQKAIGTFNWSVEVPLQSGSNIIEAIAIDNYGDTSLVETLRNVIYKEKDPAHIDFIYPNQRSNVVRKCQRGQEYSFHFKIAVDSTIDVNQLSFVFEDSSGARRGGFRVKALPDDSKMKIFGYNEYCFFASYNISGSPNHCSIDAEEDYYYRIEYSGEERVVLPQRIKIHLTSFSSELDQNEPCNCE